MENVKTTTPAALHYTTIALSVLLAFLALFYMDEGTSALTDLFTPDNLMGLIIYCTPTFVISFLLFKFLSKKMYRSESIFLSLVIGIPLGFLMVILLLFAIKG